MGYSVGVERPGIDKKKRANFGGVLLKKCSQIIVAFFQYTTQHHFQAPSFKAQCWKNTFLGGWLEYLQMGCNQNPVQVRYVISCSTK